MAASIRHFARICVLDKGPVYTIFTRLGSRYEKSFVDSTKTLDAIQEPVSVDDVRRYSKIKAALIDDSTFVDYDPIVQKFTNMVMEKGKKKLARDIVNRTFENVKRIQVEKYHRADEKTKPTIELDPVKVFHQAVENGKPVLHTTKVVKGGMAYQVPVVCPPNRQLFMSLNWLIDVSLEKDRTVRFYDKLAYEIVDAYNYEGRLIKKKQELHKLCEANKAYAHYK